MLLSELAHDRSSMRFSILCVSSHLLAGFLQQVYLVCLKFKEPLSALVAEPWPINHHFLTSLH